MSRHADPNDWMWAQACDFIAQAERMHRQFFRLGSSAAAQASWEPPADVFEDESEVMIVVALPGVAPDRVQVAEEAGAGVGRAQRPPPVARAPHALAPPRLP